MVFILKTIFCCIFFEKIQFYQFSVSSRSIDFSIFVEDLFSILFLSNSSPFKFFIQFRLCSILVFHQVYSLKFVSWSIYFTDSSSFLISFFSSSSDMVQILYVIRFLIICYYLCSNPFPPNLGFETYFFIEFQFITISASNRISFQLFFLYYVIFDDDFRWWRWEFQFWWFFVESLHQTIFSLCWIDSLSSSASTVVIGEIVVYSDFAVDMIWRFLSFKLIFEWCCCYHFRYWLHNWSLIILIGRVCSSCVGVMNHLCFTSISEFSHRFLFFQQELAVMENHGQKWVC